MYDFTGVRRQKTEDRRQETGDRRQSFSVTLKLEIDIILTIVLGENLPLIEFHTSNQQRRLIKK
ncbi:hypothetical protein [Okeania sp. SIO1I7]|uniref:hypothetical protein n=1 Tax=Okeania sp. SIO1I7 TaxID=2607772 RepID=UPI0013F9E013|nr:hypothetical protein [Okeania sp. SIO1I7]NET27151.1 hypothetical protein [Okeania sp. SIO1I7]